MSPNCYTASIGMLAMLAGLSSAPCALANDGTASIKGAVSLDGKPLPGGRIFFFRNEDQFVGSKIKEGSFKLDHVPLGKYRVALEAEGLPRKYSSEEHSGLVIEVVKGVNEIAFELTSG